MARWVLDTSAALALLLGEPGRDVVRAAVADGVLISAVNVGEIATKVADSGGTRDDIDEALAILSAEMVPFDSQLAIEAGMLRPLTRSAGLSLGDHACIALGRQTGLPVLTGDRIWARLPLGVTVHLIR